MGFLHYLLSVYIFLQMCFNLFSTNLIKGSKICVVESSLDIESWGEDSRKNVITHGPRTNTFLLSGEKWINSPSINVSNDLWLTILFF